MPRPSRDPAPSTRKEELFPTFLAAGRRVDGLLRDGTLFRSAVLLGGLALLVPAYFFGAFWWLGISAFCDENPTCYVAPVFTLEVAALAAAALLSIGVAITAIAWGTLQRIRPARWLLVTIIVAAAAFVVLALLSIGYSEREIPA